MVRNDCYVFLDPKDGGKKKRALVMSRSRWDDLQAVVDQPATAAQEAEERAQEMNQRRVLSQQMAQTWDNTYMNMRKKRFEEMESRRAIEDAEKEKQYWEMRREEERLREEIRGKAKEMLRHEKDSIKSMDKAFLLAETLRERNAQIALEKEIKKKKKEMDDMMDNKIIQDYQNYLKELEEEKIKSYEMKQKLNAENRNMLTEIEQEKKKKEMEQIMEERELIQRMIKDLERIENNEKLEMDRRKKVALMNYLESKANVEAQKKIKAEEDQEEATAIRIVAECKRRLAETRRNKEIESQKAAAARLDKVTQMVAADKAERDDIENAMVEKAVKKKEALEDKRKQDDLDHIEKMKQERIQSYQEHLKNEMIKKEKQREIDNWALLQRYKKDELGKQLDNRMENEIRAIIMDNKESWKAQIEERKARDREERQEDLDALNKAKEIWKAEDEDFLRYGEEILKECEEVSRPTYPIHWTIEDYKKRFGLVPRKPLSPTWKSRVPVNNADVEKEFRRRERESEEKRCPIVGDALTVRKCHCQPRNGMP